MRPPARPAEVSDCTRRQVLRALAAGTGGSLLSGTGLAGETPSAGLRAQQQSGIVEEAWVETDTDTDDTGVPDRVHVELLRPPDSGPDQQVSVVLRPAPYRDPREEVIDPEAVPGLPEFARDREAGVAANEVELYNPSSSTDTASVAAGHVAPGPSATALFSELIKEDVPYEEHLLDEGYAFGYVAPPGSSLSTGCSSLGGPAEVEGVVAAIDWLNGRRPAYDQREGGTPVEAPWTDGTTGLFGESYRGALANAVATVDPDGLETVVSMRSLSNWYTYLRSKGAVIWPNDEGPSQAISLASLGLTVTTREDATEHCADVLGDIAGQLDRETGNLNDFWAARNYLPDADGVSASVLLVHGLYDTNTRPREFAQWLDALQDSGVPYNVWLHQGGHDDPIDRHEEPWLDRLLAWYDYWLGNADNGIMDEPPVVVEREDESLAAYGDWPDPAMERVPLAVRPDGTATGELAIDPPTSPTTESFVDNSTVSPREFTGEEYSEHRLAYRSGELGSSLRGRGRVRPELRLSFDSETALVSGALVDYGPDEATLVNRGWMNPLNRESLRESTALEPGVAYDLQFQLQPVDYVFEAGHRVGFVLYASDYDVTKRPPSSPELTLHLQESRVDVPLVGGADELAAALDGGTDPDDDGDGDDNSGDDSGDGDDNSGDDSGDGDGNSGDDSGDGDDNSGDDSGDGDDNSGGDDSEGDDGDDDTGSADGDGAGLGVASAVAGVGGLGYLLGRRLDDGED